MPIMSQLDRVNYAILKQEIEGPKVTLETTATATNGYTNSGRPTSHDSLSSRSVSGSVTSFGSQNSVMKNSRISPPSPAKTTDEDEPRHGTVSEKLAFFESKSSPEPPRPKSSLSTQSSSNSVNLFNSLNGNNNNNNCNNKPPDLLDELKESNNNNQNHSNLYNNRSISNFVSSASSEDILKTITASKHQRSLSLLEGPAPDVVPTQSPPYYYSDLSLSAQSSCSRDSLREGSKPLASRRKHSSISSSPPQSNGLQQNPKKQSWSCENLLKNQSLKLPEATQSANCLLDAEPFYENIGFGCKSSAIQGPEPQSSPAKISFLADSSTQEMKTTSVDEQNTPQSSQESLQQKSTNSLIRTFCGLSTEQENNNVNNHFNSLNNNRRQHLSVRSDNSTSEMCFGPPDLIQSALNSSGDHGDEIFAQIINSISCPSKIEIPERYVPESDSEADFSAVERLARYHKADSIRRRIAGQSRDQANRLTVNQVIAKQAKHVSKIVAAHH